MPPTDDVFRRGLSLTLERTDLSGLGAKYEGKVRDCYMPGDGRRILVTTDRISAFDRVLGTLPFKGQILNGLSSYWFQATADVAPNHVLSVPDPNVTIALDPLRARRARDRRAPPAGRDEEERAPAGSDPHAEHQGPEGRARRHGQQGRAPLGG
jgi:hypothetical protein